MTKVDEFVDALRLERLRQRRKQGELAAEIGVDQTRLCAWEALRYTPEDPSLRRWAAALGVDVPVGVRGFSVAPAACGTPSGAQRHRKLGETTCEPCRVAWNRYVREYRSRVSVTPP